MLSHSAAAASPDIGADREALAAVVAAGLAEHHGDPRSALAAWQKLSSLIDDVPDIQRNMLRQSQSAGDYRSAQAYADQLWKSGDKNFEVRLILVSRAIKSRRWNDALSYVNDELDRGYGREWERLFAPVMLGWIAVGRKDRNFISAAGDASNNPGLQAHLGLMALAMKDRVQARNIAANLRPTDRVSQLASLQLAMELDNAGLNDAANDLRSRIRLIRGLPYDPIFLVPTPRANTPANATASWMAALAESFSHIPELASALGEGLARNALFLAPEQWSARLLLAKDLQDKNRLEDALGILNVKGNIPAIARLARADILFDLKREDAAQAEAERAVSDPAAPLSLLILHTEFMRKTGDKLRSEAGILRLIDGLSQSGQDPNLEALLLITLADLRLEKQSWDETRPLVERALRLAPNNAAVLNFAGYSAIERRIDLSQSLGLIEKAYALELRNYSIIDSLGWAYYLLGRHAEAVPLLETAWQGESDNAVIAEHLGDAYWTVGRRYEARNMWRAADFSADENMKVRLQVKLQNGLSDETAAP